MRNIFPVTISPSFPFLQPSFKEKLSCLCSASFLLGIVLLSLPAARLNRKLPFLPQADEFIPAVNHFGGGLFIPCGLPV